MWILNIGFDISRLITKRCPKWVFDKEASNDEKQSLNMTPHLWNLILKTCQLFGIWTLRFMSLSWMMIYLRNFRAFPFFRMPLKFDRQTPDNSQTEFSRFTNRSVDRVGILLLPSPNRNGANKLREHTCSALSVDTSLAVQGWQDASPLLFSLGACLWTWKDRLGYVGPFSTSI